ncbi:RAN binding protein, putative [Candida dubliniensis CD36]|uniref:RAN-specific GTPase-activating protein subunit, putative n=1 Tax=Candida dubliniensis (strain CD36 / ATCC MYA-646 / CBS 7987 / NCPF 3949 / NRRL Y-17841) TaxID=573826 RepID=B9W9Y2_CANDC|nr:RAN binding protein, putative [Candida dubliniensis CD36]CAX45620.1 RAN binding protein, putative [Candida dubliniensis CD36]
MDQILIKASNQAVSFAIRSGISLASGYAIKTISTFLDKIPESAQHKIQNKRNKLKTKIDIVTVTIDLIKLAAARGNTVLESSLQLINDLQTQLNEFDNNINEISLNLSGANEKESIKQVENYMNSLLYDINEAIPILNLVLATSGVNFNGKVNVHGISPGRLLQAANYINNPTNDTIGPDFDLVVYSIFYNPSRLKYIDDNVDELACINWKETFARSSVTINKQGDYQYQLKINEDFNDGRYHDDEEDKPGEMIVDLKSIQSMFFTASGKLLRLEERSSPVLIIKILKQNGSEEWVALGELKEGEFDEDSDEDQDDNKPVDKINTNRIKNSSLSLLEYLIRLCRLEEIESKSILDIPDEVLSLYLHDQVHDQGLPKTLSQKKKDELKKINKENTMTMDSNINRLKNLDIKEPKKKSK